MEGHSESSGSGAPFIILHGFLGMGDNWKTLGKKYSELGFGKIRLIGEMQQYVVDDVIREFW